MVQVLLDPKSKIISLPHIKCFGAAEEDVNALFRRAPEIEVVQLKHLHSIGHNDMGQQLRPKPFQFPKLKSCPAVLQLREAGTNLFREVVELAGKFRITQNDVERSL